MFKFLLVAITSLLFFTSNVNADSNKMIVSQNSDFSNPTTNFASGQTIFVKMTANSQGTQKHQLNLRDNQYNLLSTYNLENASGNEFKGSLSAPQDNGYYSLEARVESEGSVSTAVKTIKVGTATNSNSSVKVDLKVNSGNQQVLGNVSQEDSVDQVEEQSPSPTAQVEQQQEDSDQISQQADIQISFFQKIETFIKKLFEGIF